MNLAEALATTGAVQGPRSNLAAYLDSLDGDTQAVILAELNGKRQAAHLSRALTLMARKSGVIGSSATISGASITKWREANGS